MSQTIISMFDELEKISMSARLLSAAADAAKRNAGFATKALHIAAPLQARGAMIGINRIPKGSVPKLENLVAKRTGQANRFAQAAAVRV